MISIISGKSPSIPVIVTPRAATNAVAPTEADVDNATNPAAISDIPAPIPSAAIPNKANAPANPNMTGIKGCKASPATPITTNAPAIATKLFIIFSRLILPNLSSVGANTAIAPAATSNAADPLRDPLIAFNPTASSVNETAIARRPFPMFSQLISPRLFNTGAIIAMADAIRTI